MTASEQIQTSNYFNQLGREVDRQWRHFWFTPSDPIPACLLRLVAGLLTLYYLVSFSFDLVTWFGPEGLMRRESASRLMTDFGQETIFRFSLFQVSSDPIYLWLVHAVSVGIATAFALGLWTRVTAVLTLVTLLSYVHRAPMITGFLEPVLTMLVAYLCLTPCGRYFSLDAWRHVGERLSGLTSGTLPHSQLSVMATLGLRLLQVHLIAFHLMIGLSMLAGETWWLGEAVWWLMAHSESRLIDLTWLGATDTGVYFINFLTHGIVAYMFLYVFFVWRPMAFPLVVVASVLVWTFLALVTGAIAYCILMILLSIAFVSPERLREILACCVAPSSSASDA
jgi:uncharacterized membrane protein YphA (DoxX/SURF4 family)